GVDRDTKLCHTPRPAQPHVHVESGGDARMHVTAALHTGRSSPFDKRRDHGIPPDRTATPVPPSPCPATCELRRQFRRAPFQATAMSLARASPWYEPRIPGR